MMSCIMKYLGVICSLVCLCGLAPRPLSEVKRIGIAYERDRREGRLKAIDGELLPTQKYLVRVHWVALEFELDKFRFGLEHKVQGRQRYLEDSARTIRYLIESVPYGNELGLGKVSSRCDLMVGLIVTGRWMFAEKLLMYNGMDMSTARARYKLLDSQVRLEMRRDRLMRVSG